MCHAISFLSRKAKSLKTFKISRLNFTSMENIIRQHSSKCGDIFLVFLRGRKVAAAKKTIKAFSCGEGKKRSLNATILGRFCGGESSKGRACSISPIQRGPGKIKPLVPWHLNIFSTGPTIGWWTQAWLIRAEHKSERRKKGRGKIEEESTERERSELAKEDSIHWGKNKKCMQLIYPGSSYKG